MLVKKLTHITQQRYTSEILQWSEIKLSIQLKRIDLIRIELTTQNAEIRIFR